ncbi:phosphoribosyltransferase-like protein [Halodesulfovibrio aestuarii]|uniref:phosphoribosyltransferase-like protein n=1 Tax=Halodesulfovibrio aestuarii TaxID=126333 RepID=UPI0004261832
MSNNVVAQSLSYQMLERSSEIQDWLQQFKDEDQITAKLMLTKLKFYSYDSFTSWLANEFDKFPSDCHYGLYSIRKVNEEACYWKENGEPIMRPASSLGSEDFVTSLIATLVKKNNQLLDHPSLSSLKEFNVRKIILIDDSIGSGERVATFINLMLKHPTLLSWWSYGLIKIHVLAFASTSKGKEYIYKHVVGSNHHKRVHPLSQKLNLHTVLTYDSNALHSRWGKGIDHILSLCDRYTKVAPKARRGYGKVMGNTIFHHSVPNNIPGIFHSQRKGWKPLFPKRALPNWCIKLLSSPDVEIENIQSGKTDIVRLLLAVKKGIRKKASLARYLSCDETFIEQLLAYCIKKGFLLDQRRLSRAGKDFLIKEKSPAQQNIAPDYSVVYIPKSWSVDR